ncbi:hypothetical protein [Longimicrobium sp.]|jgi:hypothetical protein|uniref:hypothetical protein n=1 Tax=Longimicrobium sp. TaxID=2029185 RepID=UPI002ED8CEDD
MTQIEFTESEPTEPEFEVRRAMKKPVEIQSVKATTDNLREIVEWIEGNNHAAVLGEGQLIIQTLEGPFTVRPGDYVMRGIRGEFYRCDAEIYSESYDDLGPAES